MKYVIQFVRLLIPTIAGWVLCQAIGLAPAIAVALVCSVALPVSGAILLRSLTTDEMTWKNRVAGWLLPWGYKLGHGKLPAITIISGVVWALLFGLGIIGGLPVGVETTAVRNSTASGLVKFLLVLSWAVDGAALFYLAWTLSQNADLSKAPGSTLAKLVGIVVLIIGVSFTFWMVGSPTIALWIAGLPPLAIGLFYGAFVVLLVTVGKNARWN